MGKQVDLFLDSMIDAPIKDDQNLMEFPFFSLQKQPNLSVLTYERDDIFIEVSPGIKGLATIWDKDILLYVVTKLNEMNRTRPRTSENC